MRESAIYDSEGNALVNDLVIMKIRPTSSSEFSKYILEDGTAITDNQINRQTKIEVELVACKDNYNETYQKVDADRISGKPYIIQTKVKTYTSMYITEITFDESADVLGAVKFTVNFVEQIFATATYSELEPIEQKDEPTQSNGTKQPIEQPKNKSWAVQGKDSIRDWYKNKFNPPVEASNANNPIN